MKISERIKNFGYLNTFKLILSLYILLIPLIFLGRYILIIIYTADYALFDYLENQFDVWNSVAYYGFSQNKNLYIDMSLWAFVGVYLLTSIKPKKAQTN